jgi:ABC-type antimicrobial peptide transport system permease subunit
MRFTDYLSLSLRSLRRSRVRSLLTIFAIVIGATGITVMLTFVTSVKNLTVASFVKTGQIKQIQVSQSTDMRYDPTGTSGGYNNSLKTTNASAPTPLTPALEAKIAALPHVTAVAGTLRSRNPAISNINYNGKNWVVQAVIGYQPTGAINPPLLAGRDLSGSDTGYKILISKSYADVMGFAGKYDKAIGVKINLHTMQGYTGAGVNLLNQLPPMIQCKQTQQGNQQNCFGGPTSGMPAINIPATIVGVLDNSNGDDQPLLMMPLNSFISIFNQAQPLRVNYPSQQRPNQNCKPGIPCPLGNGNGGGNAGNQMPSGPGVVQGGWNQPTTSAFITNAGGFDSFMAQADDITHVAEVASAISRLGVGTTTGLKALNDQKAQANIIGLVLGALGMIALLIASLGVMNTMIMSVLQRTREIGVMRALGARRRTIRRIFTIEATAIGFFGGLIGVAFGSIFVLVAKPVITKMAKSGSLTGATFTVPPWLMLTVIAGTSAIGFLSGFFPARRAANLDPVEALRYE